MVRICWRAFMGRCKHQTTELKRPGVGSRLDRLGICAQLEVQSRCAVYTVPRHSDSTGRRCHRAETTVFRVGHREHDPRFPHVCSVVSGI